MKQLQLYFSEFIHFLHLFGIDEGDIVYVGSDVSGILLGAQRELGIKTREEQQFFLDNLVNSLQKTVGERGTLLFPNFTWRFCKGDRFDYRITHGEIGVLNNFILDHRKDFIRTRHPIYNFMVWGKDASLLSSMDNQDSWSEDSPFGYLHRKHAKQINLNVPFNKCITFQHYIEQCINVPYRYKKFFWGKYVDEFGIESERIYSMYVRDLRIKSSPNLPEEFFIYANAAKIGYFHEYKVIFMELDKIYDCIKKDLMSNKGRNIYHFDGYDFIWDKKKTHQTEIKISNAQIIEIQEDLK